MHRWEFFLQSARFWHDAYPAVRQDRQHRAGSISPRYGERHRARRAERKRFRPRSVSCQITCLTPYPSEAYSYTSNFEGWILGAGGPSAGFIALIRIIDGTSLPRPPYKPAQEKTMKISSRTGVVVAIVCAILLMMLAAAPGWAQTCRGTIQGTITDSTGAALVGATGTIHNVDTGIDRITQTNNDGSY